MYFLERSPSAGVAERRWDAVTRSVFMRGAWTRTDVKAVLHVAEGSDETFIKHCSVRKNLHINIDSTKFTRWVRGRAAVMVKEQFRETDVAKKM